MSVLSQLKNIEDEQLKFIASLEEKYSAEAIKLQKKLLQKMNESILSKLRVVDGQVENSLQNYEKVYKFNKIWQEYSEQYLFPTVANIANDCIKVSTMSGDFFRTMGEDAIGDMTLLNKAAGNIELMLGIERKAGEMVYIKDGYMDRLLTGADVKNRVMTVLTDSISVKSDINELTKNLAEQIEGSEGVNGAMERYFGTYVYDTFSGVQRAYGNYVAEQADLTYFQYAGTVMGKTRVFCAEKAGLYFTVQDLEAWANEDWAGKNWSVPVEISLGGYNCRHILRWLPNDIGKELYESQDEKGLTRFDEPDRKTIDSRIEDEDKKYKANEDKLTADDKEGLRNYKSSSYRDMNHYARHGTLEEAGASESEITYTKKWIEGVDNSIDKSDKFEGLVVRYTGLSQDNFDNLMSQVKDGFVMDKGFSSFSVDPHISKGFAKVWKDANVKFTLIAKGKNGAYLNPGEAEVIFRRNTRYAVAGTRKIMVQLGQKEYEFLEILMEEL